MVNMKGEISPHRPTDCLIFFFFFFFYYSVSISPFHPAQLTPAFYTGVVFLLRVFELLSLSPFSLSRVPIPRSLSTVDEVKGGGPEPTELGICALELEELEGLWDLSEGSVPLIITPPPPPPSFGKQLWSW